jgi:hypothetical protein
MERGTIIKMTTKSKPFMKKPLIKIGSKTYKFKKDVILHYRKILNSYDFGQSLNESDFYDLIDLLNYDSSENINEFETAEDSANEKHICDADWENNEQKNEPEVTINDIKIVKVQYNTKCFEIVYSDNTSEYISYLMYINNSGYTPEKLFDKACRSSIQGDIRTVKQEYFDRNSQKGRVKCQETGLLSKWEELVVDHRQPNTFSIIVERFKEVYRINLDDIDYSTDDQNNIIFKDENLTKAFRNYHKEKASLRIVRKECNSSRTGQARVKRTSKDLTIKQ